MASADFEKLLEEINNFLPGATKKQAEDFAKQVSKLENLKVFFEEFPEDYRLYQESIARATKALNYKKSYQIAVIGTTGVGKSTLINAMLGRDLVLMKDIGKPATGAALQIFLDVHENGQERALVSYRDEEDIHNLIREFVNRYKAQGVDLSGSLNLNVVTSLAQLPPPSNLTTERAKGEFKALAKSLSDLVEQFLNHQSANLDSEFLLTNQRDQEDLKALIDENSKINQSNSSQRRIGLIKYVSYHINPGKSSNNLKTLKLPNNVCLVDLPGLDGTPLHDIIISEGVGEADAVVFILRPPRILDQGDTYLINRVQEHLGLMSSDASNERVFVVLNARDAIMQDEGSTPKNLPHDMEEFLELLSPTYNEDPRLSRRGGNNAYFMTSAWAAYCAQKRIKGEIISQGETYDATRIKLGIRDADDFKVLEASRVPRLVESLTDFAREHRVDGQIREGEMLLKTVIKQLNENYRSRRNQLTEDRGEFYFKEKLHRQLEDQKFRLHRKIVGLRKEILKEDQFEGQKKELQRQAKSICDEVDRKLTDKMPEIWKEHFKEGLDRLNLGLVGKALYEPLLADMQIFIWKQLNDLLRGFADTLANNYRSHVKSYKMAQVISKESYEFIPVAKVESVLEECIDKMHETISSISNRVAMVWMTDTDTYFSQFDEEQKPAKKNITDSIAKLPAKRDLPVGSFRDLVKAIRSDYEDSIVSYCVRGLLNLYRYELILVEDKMWNIARDAFETMRNEDEASLKVRMQGESDDPEWQEAITLQTKLNRLASLVEIGDECPESK